MKISKRAIVLANVLVWFLFGMAAFLTQGFYFYSEAESICRTNDKSQSYCRYKGKVSQLYANSDGFNLYFFETPFRLNDAKEKGYNILSGAAGLVFQDDLEKKAIQKSLELAFENNLSVEIHMRNVEKGYLEIDRVWVKQ